MKHAELVVVFSFVFLLSTNSVFAQEEILPLTGVPTPTPTPKVIEYTLPYPGLLPDSPLYFLKTIRDRLMLFLIADVEKKTEFDLLQADKRLNSGVYLAKRGQYTLAQSTISKGANYFEDAVGSAILQKQQGMAVKDVLEKLLLSSKKHQQTIGTLAKQAPKDQQKAFLTLQKRMASYEKQLTDLTLKVQKTTK